ncbi:uncharacterized protein MKK02DRAFT_40686 [Dioszegia hungarica]|uniref:UDP-N-acetylglucosamine diphosphorylase n=1 Tax=Dioszegia hungarica TaxID=4972 RepID=A0AA38LPQ5_9TREE|nr:uncharacterized protein MKK02DRAFT_40686 [Dioszegia hungarica]KAI9632382.1 hypothetical protein MKK02DRAFT_40686 [Dioszegia hungarica]
MHLSTSSAAPGVESFIPPTKKLKLLSGKKETVTPAPNVSAIILAADHGELMRSKKPVVLHECAGLQLIAHAVRLALQIEPHSIILVTRPETQEAIRTIVEESFPTSAASFTFALQEKTGGSREAVRAGLAAVPPDTQQVVILPGNMPLLRLESL